MKPHRTLAIAAAIVGALALAACSERPTATATIGEKTYRGKPDTNPWEAERTVFSAGNFAPGDRAGWEEAMRKRAQAQNEFQRIQ
ncbi:MAG TPA: hypothetical protein VM491_15880 [Burkholderiaceae bacterium]|jgi:hypothetical protein|nr:hypothetical protein [Burkholderiaceae bacterium]